MEYLQTHRGGRGQSFEYELPYDMADVQPDKQLMRLIEVDKLTYDANQSGVNVKSRGHIWTQRVRSSVFSSFHILHVIYFSSYSFCFSMDWSAVVYSAS